MLPEASGRRDWDTSRVLSSRKQTLPSALAASTISFSSQCRRHPTVSPMPEYQLFRERRLLCSSFQWRRRTAVRESVEGLRFLLYYVRRRITSRDHADGVCTPQPESGAKAHVNEASEHHREVGRSEALVLRPFSGQRGS